MVAPTHDHTRRRNLKRIVVALAIVIGLAGILPVSAPGDDGEPAGRAPVG